MFLSRRVAEKYHILNLKWIHFIERQQNEREKGRETYRA